MGGSYGGYAVLAGLAFAPEIFVCGVDMYGPSNLLTLLNSSHEIEEDATVIGDPRTEEGRKLLEKRSPLNFVDQIRRPLLVGQGANDHIVNRKQSDQIVQAMQKTNLTVTYVLFPDEGHSFERPDYAVAEAFLSQHLGGRLEPIGADLQGSTITVPAGADEIPGLEESLRHQ
jgi:dipeptidyl aminopeptidase/acylaminoacyl peptidase